MLVMGLQRWTGSGGVVSVCLVGTLVLLHLTYPCVGHTEKDAGAMTILAQDDVGGLEVKRKTDGDWIFVKPTPNAFIINVGDIIQVFGVNDTYGECRAHRLMFELYKRKILLHALICGYLDLNLIFPFDKILISRSLCLDIVLTTDISESLSLNLYAALRSCVSTLMLKAQFKRTSLTRFPSQNVGSSNADALESPYLLVLINGTSQSRQHDKSESNSYYLSD
ncbi:DMR6-like oxygenase 2-like protein [Tanacetum coccineum]